MKSAKLYRLVLILIIILFVFAGCTKKEQPGIIWASFSSNSPRPLPPGAERQFNYLEVNFSDSVAQLELIGKEVTDKIGMTPSHPGKWEFIQDDRLIFSPEQDWFLDQEYTITLDKILFAENVRLERNKFSFKTPTLEAAISSIYYYISPVDPDEKRIIATFRFNYPLDVTGFESKVKLQVVKSDKDDVWYTNKSFKYDVTYNDLRTEAYIQSEVLPIPAEDVSVRLTLDKGVRSSLGGGPINSSLEEFETVFGMSNYIKVLDMRIQNVKGDDYNLQQLLVLDTKGESRVEDLASKMKVYLLPIDKPAQPGAPMIKNYGWSDVKIIDNTILNQSQNISFDSLPTERDISSLTSYRLNLPENRYVFVRLEKGIPFYGGYILPKTVERILKVPVFPKEISIMSDGAILSMAGDKKISMLAYNIKYVEYSASRLLDDQVHHLVSQSNGDLNNLRFKSYYFNESNITDKKQSTAVLNLVDPGKPQYFSFDFSSLVAQKGEPYGSNGIFFFEVSGKDADRRSTVSDKRLVIITDLGILVKSNADGSRDLFVQSIASGNPVAGAKVEVIGKNGLSLYSSTTDTGGHLALPALSSFYNEKSPTAFVVTKGNDLSFLPYDGNGRWLDYSGFETGGVYGQSDPAALSAYLFSDRGIYRPGDSINIGMIIKTSDWSRSLTGIPLEASISDSRGLEVYNRRIRLSQEGFEELSYKTEYTSPTGEYHVNLYHIRQENYRDFIGSVTVKVEEFLPDRMRLTTGFSILPSRGWIKPTELKAVLKLENLFGTPATDCNVNGQYTISPAGFYFSEYRNYRFHDPFRAGNSYTEFLGSITTDEEGTGEFAIDLSSFGSSTYRVAFLAEAFEKGGGRSVTSENSIIVSPLEYIIGSKSESDLSYVYKGSDVAIDFIALDPDAKPLLVKDLTFKLNEVKWVSVLTKLSNGTYRYQSVEKRIPVKNFNVVIPATGLKFPVPTDKAGEFELVVYNSEETELNRKTYSVVSRENLTRRLDKNAELKIRLSKTDYRPGEEIEVFVQAPFAGSGLITIERDKVYAYKWFTSRANSFTERITIPADMEGNAYLNVSYIRSIDSKEIYMSPLSYGIVNFSLSKDKRTTEVTLDIPSEARPGKGFPIKYKTNKKSKIVIYAVDEGILQVAGYSAPDPLSFFFKKKALEVQTSQILDLILPEFSVVQSLAAMGGGGDFDAIAKNLNPFKRKSKPPVVFWSGILDADPTEKQIEYEVPGYFNGSLHVFAVAVNNESIGVTEEMSVIRDYFVITPNIPLFAAPGDKFTVSVSVANTVKGSGEKASVVLKTASSSHLKGEAASTTLGIPEGKDATVSLSFTVNDVLGAAEINFTAESGGYSSSLSESLSIRPPVPYITKLTTGYLNKDSGEVDVSRQLYPHYRTKEASLSFVPLGISKGLLQYLSTYPYGCSEQFVSRGFPYVALSRIKEFGVNFNMAEAQMNDVIRVLRSRQTQNGAFGIWAANSYTDPFVNVYALHFLTDAREAGFYVPQYVVDKSIGYLKKYVEEDKTDFFELEIKAYAIYVLTRNEIITTSYIEKLMKKYENANPYWEMQSSGLFIAASLMMLQDKNRAENLIKKFEVAQKRFERYNVFYNRYLQNAQFLYILSKHFPAHLKRVSKDLIDFLTGAVESGYYNTIFSSYVILALTEYVKATDVLQNGKVTVSEVDKDKNKTELEIPDNLFPAISITDAAVKLLLENKEKLGLYYQVVEAGFDRVKPDKKVSKGIEVFKEFANSNGKIVTSAGLGEELEVRLKIRSSSAENMRDMVIVDLVPGGFEPVLDAEPGGNLTVDYFDRREDRMVVYCRIDKSAKDFSYKIKAVNKGTYSVPPVFAENMYDKEIQALSPFDSALVVSDPVKN